MKCKTNHPCTASWGLVLGALCVALGCSDAGPKTYAVSGLVTLDGRPLEEGDIYFYSRDPQISADYGKIKGGRFAFRAKAGSKRVEIKASGIVPGKKTPMGGPVRINVLPSRYNTESTLTREVLAGGDNEYVFALETDP
jgi:hypothetical protein